MEGSGSQISAQNVCCKITEMIKLFLLNSSSGSGLGAGEDLFNNSTNTESVSSK